MKYLVQYQVVERLELGYKVLYPLQAILNNEQNREIVKTKFFFTLCSKTPSMSTFEIEKSLKMFILAAVV